MPRTTRSLQAFFPAALLAVCALAVALEPAAGLGAGGETATDPTSHRAEVEAFWRKRDASLRSPTGWLTLVGRTWLKEGDNTVGSAKESAVPLPEGKAPATLGVVRLAKGEAVFAAAPGAGVTSGGKEVTRTVLAPDVPGPATVLAHGTLTLFVIERGGRLGVRVKDSEAATLRGFKGVERYPINAGWRFVARFEPHVPPRKVDVPTVLGTTEAQESPGALVFTVGKTVCRLDALTEDDALFLVFGDGTNGKETYGGGRFLYTEKPGADGTVVVDFNRAVNPPCVFTPHATCPLPPAGNRLPVRITAGEKVYGKH